jgi:hypothetical protein
MPHFGTKSLLIGFVVAALWLSTFSGYRAAQDVRHSILLLILVASGFMAIYSRGRRRAFWAGYFVVMFCCGGLDASNLLSRYVPGFAWLDFEAPDPNLPQAPTPLPSVATPYIAGQAHAPPINYAVPATPLYNGPLQMPGSTPQAALNETISAAWTIALAVIAGFVAVYIFGQMWASTDDAR